MGGRGGGAGSVPPPQSAPTPSRCLGVGCGACTCAFPPGVMDYVREMRELLSDLQTRVQKAKLNMENITQLTEVAFAGAFLGAPRGGAEPSRHGSTAPCPLPAGVLRRPPV